MPEQTTETQVTQEAQTQETQTQEPKVDLVTRVSQVKKSEVKTEDTEGKFNINELDSHIEKIQDPNLKEQFVGLKKSLLRGENQKYQEIASLRKQYEHKLAESTTWTPERLQQELQKPDFVQAAQSVLQTGNPRNSGVSDEQWSALSEAEKAELTQLKQKISILEQNNWQAVKSQQDAQLRTKYANYAPDIIDNLTQEMIQGKRQATREDIWKVVDYDDAVRRAYELGLMDKNTQTQEKVNGMTFMSGRNIQQPSAVEKEKGETAQQFFKRSYTEHTKKT